MEARAQTNRRRSLLSYEQLLQHGRAVTRDEISRDVNRLFSGNFNEWIKKTKTRLRKKGTIAFSICVAIVFSFLLPVFAYEVAGEKFRITRTRLPVERRVADLLSRMTLEEKVAQLTCLWQPAAGQGAKQISLPIAVISLPPKRRK